MTDKDQWEELLNHKDTKSAVYQHLSLMFSFVNDKNKQKALLDEVCQKATGIEVQEEKLVIDFEGGFQLKCSDPAKHIADNVPKSYAQMAKVHHYIELEIPHEVPISFYGVGEEGGLFASELIVEAGDSSFYEKLEETNLNSDAVFHALMYGQDELVFSPLKVNQCGEPFLYFIDHGDCEPRPFASSNLCFSEVFLIIIAEKILNRELLGQLVEKVSEIVIGSSSFPLDTKNLALDRMHISKLGPEIGQLENLVILTLTNCNLSTLPKEIGKLTKLKKLELENNGLISLPEEIGNLISLQELDINEEKLNELPESIGKLKNLEELRIQKTELTNLPEGFCSLTSLKSISLIKNIKLKGLPENIGNLSKVTKLWLDGCENLEYIPEGIGGMVSLKKLRISEGKLKELPKSIGKLKNLEEFWIKKTELTSLPEEFCALTSLKSVFLIENTKLKSLPENIGNLSEVTKLNLNDCKNFEHIPLGISGMTQLEEFGALRTSINTASFTHLCGALQLKKIDITEAQVSHLSKEIGNLKNLKRLNLENNPIEGMAQEIGQLSVLEYLDLDGGLFAQIPDKLGDLAKLEYLSLGGKAIGNIPKTMAGLTRTTFIRIAGCTLEQVPEWLLTLPSLRTLCLEGWPKLESIGDAIGSGKISHLWLFDCPNLKNISPQITRLEGCSDIAIRHSAINEELFDTLCQIATLEELEISNSALRNIPGSIAGHESLLKLSLSNNQIAEVSPEIKTMKKLWYLNMEGNQIEKLPGEIFEIPELHTLNLSKNPITGFPEGLPKAENLSELILKNCEKLSLEDIRHIQKSLPKCEVVFEE